MKTVRIREFVVQTLYLRGTLSTGEIYNMVNDKFRHGNSMNALCNILSKSKDFVRAGQIQTRGNARNGSYLIQTWDLSDDALDRYEAELDMVCPGCSSGGKMRYAGGRWTAHCRASGKRCPPGVPGVTWQEAMNGWNPEKNIKVQRNK